MATRPSRCFHCGSADLEDKEVEELVRGGRHVVALNVRAAVCRKCGERYFEPETVRRFESVRYQLDHDDLSGFRAIGQVLEPVGA